MGEPPTASGGPVASVLSDVTARFTAIYEANFGILVKILKVMGATPEEAEDAAQDAMTDLFRRLKAGGEPPRTPDGWVLTAAKRFFLKRRKRDRVRWMREIKAFPPQFWDDTQELATYLDLLDESDRRLTPERIAGKLGDLLDHVSAEQTPPSGEGGGTSGSLGLIVAGAGVAAWYLARRRFRKMPPQWHPDNLDPAAGRGEDAHMQEERLW
jgi:DNA-directed RNA polymerase specialized sigma24 family protein